MTQPPKEREDGGLSSLPPQDNWDALCDQHARVLADMVDANEPERETIMRLSKLVRYGHRCMDVEFRKDGVVHRLQADWLARLFRVGSPLAARSTVKEGE